MSSAAPAVYRVTGLYITCRTASAAIPTPAPYGSAQLAGFHQGAILPADVPAEDIAHLLRKDLIEQVPG